MDIHQLQGLVETYTPGQSRWAVGPSSLCTHGSGVATRGADGRIYLIGGGHPAEPIGLEASGCSSGVISTLAEAYDPRTRSWTALPPMPVAVGNPAVTAAQDGRIYVLGGVILKGPSSANTLDSFAATNSVQVYDPHSALWALVAPMRVARAGAAAVTGRDGRIYAIGGSPAAVSISGAALGAALRSVEAYSPAARAWSPVAGLPTPRWGLGAAVAPNGDLYAIGGYDSAEIDVLTPRGTA